MILFNSLLRRNFNALAFEWWITITRCENNMPTSLHRNGVILQSYLLLTSLFMIQSAVNHDLKL
jgi:hypothetical protein